jgi:hypothetical protein
MGQVQVTESCLASSVHYARICCFWLEHTVEELVPETTWPLVQVLNHFGVLFLGTVVLAGRIGNWSKYHEYCHNCLEAIAGVHSKDVHANQRTAQ